MATPVKLKTCATCGDQFTPGSNRAKYCATCGRRGKGTCEVCGKTFTLHPSGSGRWCSRECAGTGRRRADMLPRPCVVCGETYKPIRSEQRYCSQDCFNEATQRPMRTCPVCGKDYDSRHYSRTCSRTCAGELRRTIPEGVNCERCGKHIPWETDRVRRFCSQACRKTPVGTRSITDSGYVRVMTESGWRHEHRHLMEGITGRPLAAHERVHHKNGVRYDNRPENLELWRIKGKDPAGVRATDYHCPGCRCGELTTP